MLVKKQLNSEWTQEFQETCLEKTFLLLEVSASSCSNTSSRWTRSCSFRQLVIYSQHSRQLRLVDVPPHHLNYHWSPSHPHKALALLKVSPWQRKKWLWSENLWHAWDCESVSAGRHCVVNKDNTILSCKLLACVSLTYKTNPFYLFIFSKSWNTCMNMRDQNKSLCLQANSNCQRTKRDDI